MFFLHVGGKIKKKPELSGFFLSSGIIFSHRRTTSTKQYTEYRPMNDYSESHQSGRRTKMHDAVGAPSLWCFHSTKSWSDNIVYADLHEHYIMPLIRFWTRPKFATFENLDIKYFICYRQGICAYACTEQTLRS